MRSIRDKGISEVSLKLVLVYYGERGRKQANLRGTHSLGWGDGDERVGRSRWPEFTEESTGAYCKQTEKPHKLLKIIVFTVELQTSNRC